MSIDTFRHQLDNAINGIQPRPPGVLTGELRLDGVLVWAVEVTEHTEVTPTPVPQLYRIEIVFGSSDQRLVVGTQGNDLLDALRKSAESPAQRLVLSYTADDGSDACIILDMRDVAAVSVTQTNGKWC